MKKYLSKIALFFVLMVVIDVAYGFMAEWLFAHAKGGDTGRLYYINRVQEEDILVFGSSRAIHHYDPRILEDSLGMSCYNCGKDGNGILTMYPILVNITNRYTPKVIIYEVTASFDLINEHNNDKYLSLSRPFYGDERVSELFYNIDESSRFKIYSSLYRYNGWLMSMLSDNLHPSNSDIKGYRPEQGIINYDPGKEKDKFAGSTIEYDNLKMEYLQMLIDKCNASGIKLIFAVSPQFMQEDDTVFSPMFELAGHNNIPVLNHYCDTDFVRKKNYFCDRTHLNGNGAEAYSKVVAQEVRDVIE